MKKFIFSLQGLRNARAAQKTAIEHELVRAQQKLAEETKLLQQLIEQIDALLTSPLPSANPTPSEFLQREKHLSMLKRKRKEQQIKVSAAETAVKVCLSKLRLADIELKKVEKLEEREHSDWQQQWQQEEQKISDEIGTSRNFYKTASTKS